MKNDIFAFDMEIKVVGILFGRDVFENK